MEGRATIAEEERSGTGPYVTLVEVAAGGMGRVDVALRVEGEFQRLYAIKRLHPHLREDPDFRQMFIEEARVAGLVRHPNVVSVLDVGVDSAGPFLVMDYIDGVSLSRLISFLAESERGLPMQVALRIAIDVARGLHAIHEARGHDGQLLRLVHRDLSPQNVLVAYAGVASITDFGIAKAVGQSQRTSTGILKGKISYMSPEQLRFEELDRRSDLFAFGVMLYEMLAGYRLYRNSGNEGAQRILHEPPPDLGDVRPDAPPALVELIFELLAKHPDERPPTAGVVARRLERILAQLVVREPTIELGSYVEGMTEQVREEQHAAIRDATSRLAKSSAAWNGISSIPISIELSLSGVSNDNTLTTVAKGRATRLFSKRNIIATGAILSTTLLVVAGMSWWMSGPSEASVPPVPTNPSAPTDRSASTASIASATDHEGSGSVTVSVVRAIEIDDSPIEIDDSVEVGADAHAERQGTALRGANPEVEALTNSGSELENEQPASRRTRVIRRVREHRDAIGQRRLGERVGWDE
jgi:serine/threonine-protein kinase